MILGYPKTIKTVKKKKRVKNERKALQSECDSLVRVLLRKTQPHFCICCGKTVEQIGWYGYDNKIGLTVSHYIERKVLVSRWDLKNCEIMCMPCNGRHNRNPLPYTVAYIKKNGIKALEYLKEIREAYNITNKTMPTWQIREKRDELQATLEALNGERATF